MVLAAGAVASALASCTTSSTPPPTPVSSPRAVGSPAPTTRTSTRVPTALDRPVTLPRVRSAEQCPTSTAERVQTPRFTGVALVAPGPVRPLLAGQGSVQDGTAFLNQDTRRGWSSVKLLWFSAASYSGPVLVRGRRLDRPGPLELRGGNAGGGAALMAAAGPALNTFDGVREWPSSAQVKGPGCYGFQVDGDRFSYTLVLRLVNGP